MPYERLQESVAPKAPLLFNMPHLSTKYINVFLGICFSNHFTVQFDLLPIHIGIKYIVFQLCPSRAQGCSITYNN